MIEQAKGGHKGGGIVRPARHRPMRGGNAIDTVMTGGLLPLREPISAWNF
jgi:hypothetical protein